MRWHYFEGERFGVYPNRRAVEYVWRGRPDAWCYTTVNRTTAAALIRRARAKARRAAA